MLILRRCAPPVGAIGASVVVRAFSVILKDPAMNERILGTGYETAWNGMPPAEFAAFHKADLAKWTKVIKDLKIVPK